MSWPNLKAFMRVSPSGNGGEPPPLHRPDHIDVRKCGHAEPATTNRSMFDSAAPEWTVNHVFELNA